jgi:hypothetical protein
MIIGSLDNSAKVSNLCRDTVQTFASHNPYRGAQAQQFYPMEWDCAGNGRNPGGSARRR